MADNQDVDKDIMIISGSTFEYIKTNETTYTCNCLTHNEKEKKECWDNFIKKENETSDCSSGNCSSGNSSSVENH